MSTEFTTSDYWRAVILYGLNTATYKIALGHCLQEFARRDIASVSMAELATAFFDLYLERLQDDRPQLAIPGRLTIMERIVRLHRSGSLERGAAIERVEREAFGDVVPRFHTLGSLELPARFYEQKPGGLVLTDALFDVVGRDEDGTIIPELNSRWDLLEAAFEMMREDLSLANDIREFYLSNGYERRPITHNRPVLNGYQNGTCFYCAEQMAEHDVHVDHLIPRQFVYHDEVWNLVLAHGFCNEQKSDALPGLHYLEKLLQRNEALIGSNHPLKRRLIEQLGATPQARREAVTRVYADAQQVIRYTWEGVRGYNPGTDPFYKAFVRRLTR